MNNNILKCSNLRLMQNLNINISIDIQYFGFVFSHSPLHRSYVKWG